jgi:hypothetical protein
MDYQCWIVAELDSGIAIHRILPQTPQAIDQLATNFLEDSGFPTNKEGGPNLKSKGSYTNIKQRMANSVYRFCLMGYARRAGYSIPFPKLKSVAGVAVVSDDDPPQQTVGPLIVANNSGIPIYYAEWKFWYTLLTPPKTTLDTPANLAEHIAPGTLPRGIQAPVTVPDQDAVSAFPNFLNPIRSSR